MTQLPASGDPIDATEAVTITADLQRAMVRDVLRITLGSWPWIILGALTGMLVVFMLLTGIFAADVPSFFFAGGLLIAAILFVLLLRSSVGKSIRSAYPVGATASAFLTDDSVTSSSALGVSEIRFTAFREVVATDETLVLKMAVRSSGVGALPRAVLSDGAVARLQQEVANASLARKGAGRASNQAGSDALVRRPADSTDD
ncbi:hypothetical protein LK09_09480 [Microbacterium mangrovi]|uniref:Uncharacterized protein n=1 Tax=Microbacterium mangrovi TaxID=1348253 RepID=A0A0B2A8T0_9MICO|nr:hypothetical protein [Microbacterium mangrovi]KHK98041.1 hypothetical protein LK09_09480 [Microbacterium mangrovi]